MGDLFNEIKEQKVDSSSFAKIRKQMNDADFEDLMKAMKDPSITGGAIYRALKKRNIIIANSTINLLRRQMNGDQ